MFKRFSPIQLLMLVIFVSVIFRLSLAVSMIYPSNDGGLFQVMIQDLLKNHFIIPAFTTYNLSSIPFSYPPFGLYFSALISLTGIPLLTIIRFLPILVTTFSIAAFYLLATQATKSTGKAIWATGVFVLIPQSFLWISMGGGLTRSFGQLFSLMTLYYAHQFFTKTTTKNKILTSVFFALTILSHPEWTLFTVVSLLVFFIFLSPSRAKAKSCFQVGALTGILISPWLFMVFHYHGLAPFIASLGAGFWDLKSYARYFFFDFTSEPGLPVIAVLGMLSAALLIYKGQYFLPVWIILNNISNPRAACNSSVIPLAIAIVCAAAYFPLQKIQIKGKALAAGLFAVIPVLAGFLLYPFFFGHLLSSLTRDSIEAMNWARNNTSRDAQFLVISPDTFNLWALDKTAEWFPAVAYRKSLTTAQGLEWTPNGQFKNLVKKLDKLQYCWIDGLSCLESWAAKSNITFTHIFIVSSFDNYPQCCSLLINDLSGSSNYHLIYKNSTAAIFERGNARN